MCIAKELKQVFKIIVKIIIGNILFASVALVSVLISLFIIYLERFEIPSDIIRMLIFSENIILYADVLMLICFIIKEVFGLALLLLKEAVGVWRKWVCAIKEEVVDNKEVIKTINN